MEQREYHFTEPKIEGNNSTNNKMTILKICEQTNSSTRIKNY